MLQFFLGQQVEAVPITHLTPLEVGPDAIAAQDATRKSYTTSVTVPADFMRPGGEYKVEVIAIERSGNRTITEVEFETE